MGDNMNTKIKGYLCAMASAVIYGCGPLAAKTVYAAGGTPTTVLLMGVFSIPAALLACLCMKVSLRITRKQAIQLLILGFVGSTITPLCTHNAYKLISSGTVTTIHFMYCVHVVVWSTLLFRDPFTWKKVLCVGLCILGVFLLYSPTSEGNALGILLALTSSMTYAFYILFLDRTGLKAMHPMKLHFYTQAIRIFLIFLYALATNDLMLDLSAKAWTVGVLYYSILSLAAAALFQLGVRYSSSTSASILSTFEPMTSVFVGILVFAEPFGVKTAVGVVCILSAVIILTVFGQRLSERKSGRLPVPADKGNLL